MLRTHRGVEQDRRVCMCTRCHLVFETVAEATVVHRGEGRAVSVEVYRERVAD